MSLFTRQTLDGYRNDPRVIDALRGIKLLNLAEFNNWYNLEPRRSERITATASNKDLYIRQIIDAEIKIIAEQVLLELANTVCIDPKTGSPAIGDAYGRNTIENLIRRNNTFDILVAVKDFTPSPTNTTKWSEVKLNHIVGFIIAEYGECRNQPDVWSVNLICTTTINNNASIKGILLLGAFLYCIKNSNNVQKGILELAGGYSNISGFISYTKIGFNKDLSLYDANCFYDFNNLPMMADVDTMDDEQIITRATDRERRIYNDEDSGLYNAGKIDLSVQRDLILCNNLLYKVQLAFNDISQDPDSLFNSAEKNKFNFIARFANTKDSMIRELENERNAILSRLRGSSVASSQVDDDTCVKQCVKGICKCIGWTGGKTKKYKRRYIQKRRSIQKRNSKKNYKK